MWVYTSHCPPLDKESEQTRSTLPCSDKATLALVEFCTDGSYRFILVTSSPGMTIGPLLYNYLYN